MSLDPLSVFSNAASGCNMVGDEEFFSQNRSGRFAWLARNLRIENGQWRTRPRWVERCLDEEGSPDHKLWHDAPTQGAHLYLPRIGQGAHYQGVGLERIIESAGGELWELTPTSENDFSVSRVGGATAGADWLLAYMEQAENYIIRTDGSSSTMVYDGKNPATFSNGFNRNNPSASKIPNGAGPVLYHADRLWVVAYDRQVFPGDVLHKQDQVDAIDLLSFEDQAFDATSVLVVPSARIGDLAALHPIGAFDDDPILGHGTGPGIFSIRTDQPRSEWQSIRLAQDRSHETAATGPYAVATRDGGSLHRSEAGLEDIRVIEQDQRSIGFARTDYGRDLEPILRADHPDFLRFASLINPPKWDRMLCTVSPWVENMRRAHRGWVSLNWNPTQDRASTQFAWEGVGSLPPEMGEVIQFLTGRLNGRQRVFALTWDAKNCKKRLLEWTMEDGPDLADTARIPIEWMLMSRKLILGSEYRISALQNAALRLTKTQGPVQWKVFGRTDRQPQWKTILSGSTKSADLGTGIIPLGKLDSKFGEQASWLQLRIEGCGVATIDFALEGGVMSSLSEERTSPNQSVNLRQEQRGGWDLFGYRR